MVKPFLIGVVVGALGMVAIMVVAGPPGAARPSVAAAEPKPTTPPPVAAPAESAAPAAMPIEEETPPAAPASLPVPGSEVPGGKWRLPRDTTAFRTKDALEAATKASKVGDDVGLGSLLVFASKLEAGTEVLTLNKGGGSWIVPYSGWIEVRVLSGSNSDARLFVHESMSVVEPEPDEGQ